VNDTDKPDWFVDDCEDASADTPEDTPVSIVTSSNDDVTKLYRQDEREAEFQR
jgi:hypothetical protein